MEQKERIEFLEKKINDLEKQLAKETGDCLPCVENILIQIRKHQWALIGEKER